MYSRSLKAIYITWRHDLPPNDGRDAYLLHLRPSAMRCTYEREMAERSKNTAIVGVHDADEEL